MHNVAVLHHVLLAFLAQLAGVAAAQLATQLHVVRECEAVSALMKPRSKSE